ncbi:MarR family winged helix-turn-helix transcriptional regulator [Sphingomonas sp. RS2018]
MEALRTVVRAIDLRAAALLVSHDLSVAEWRLLAALHDAGAVPPSLLAERLGLTRGGVTKLIDRLKARRLLVRARAGGADRRYQTIALTGAGAVLVAGLQPAMRDAVALSAKERDALSVLLMQSNPI